MDVRDAELPDDFKKIPLEHQRSRVLASVPGTRQAAEAVLLAQIPQTARVDKKRCKAPEVVYQGDAEFQPIEKTTVARAVNTDKDIIKVGDLYYMCFQGVWFMVEGAERTVGGDRRRCRSRSTRSRSARPRTTSPTSPSSRTTRRRVVFATAAAYTGVMVAWGCAVWGTGYYYPPYVGYGGFYPSTTRTIRPTATARGTTRGPAPYGRGAVAYGPYGGAGVGARYNPRTGTYSRGAPRPGARTARAALRRRLQPAHRRVRPRPARARTSTAAGAQTGVQRGDDWATDLARHQQRHRHDDARDAGQRRRRGRRRGHGPAGQTAASPAPAAATSTPAATATSTRRTGDSWQKYDNGGWNNVQQPTQAQQRSGAVQAAPARPRSANQTAMSQFQSAAAARAQGAQRTHTYSRGGGGSSYRPSGGSGGRRK